MNDPTITCPNCYSEIRLTESLAAPVLAATRREFEQQLARKDAEAAVREETLRAQVIIEEARKAKAASATELAAKVREVSELQDVLQAREAKLAEAQLAQAELIKKQRELDDAKRELELTVERRVQDNLAQVRTIARREAEDSLNLKVQEKDQTIVSMQQTIEELRRKSEQGSQQLQGEVQELQLESLLRAKFPLDLIEPVAKGEFGGDVVQRIVSPTGQVSGAILWESKRTKNWSDGWLIKLREDQRAAKAELAILVTQVLPKGIETFDLVDGVWVTNPRAALPVATALRQTLLQVSLARQTADGQQTKTEMVYAYLTGPRFKQRIEAIVEAFSSMQEDLDRERKVILKQWAKREEQISRVMNATVGMYGDLQGIAGKSLQEIEGLELPALSFTPES